MQIKDLLKKKNSLFYALANALIREKVSIKRIVPTNEGIVIEVSDRKIGLTRLILNGKEHFILRLEDPLIRFYNPHRKSLDFFPHKIEITKQDDLIEGFFFLLSTDDILNQPLSV